MHRVVPVPRLRPADVDLHGGGAGAAERGGLRQAVHLRDVASDAFRLQGPDRLDPGPGTRDLEQVLGRVDVDLVEHRAHVSSLGDDRLGGERGGLVLDDLDGDEPADAVGHHAAEVDEGFVDDALEAGVFGAGVVHVARLVHHGSLEGADVGGGVVVEGVEEDGRGHRRGLRAELLECARAHGRGLQDEMRELLELLEFGSARDDVGRDSLGLCIRGASLACARLLEHERVEGQRSGSSIGGFMGKSNNEGRRLPAFRASIGGVPRREGREARSWRGRASFTVLC